MLSNPYGWVVMSCVDGREAEALQSAPHALSDKSTSHRDEGKKKVLFIAFHTGVSVYLLAHLNGTLWGDNHENNTNYYDMIYEGNLITRKTVKDGKNSNTGMRLFGRYQKHSCNTENDGCHEPTSMYLSGFGLLMWWNKSTEISLPNIYFQVLW